MKKYYYILRYSNLEVLKVLIPEYKNYKNKDIFFLEALISVFLTMCVRYFDKKGSIGWRNEVIDRCRKLVTVSDFVEMLRDLYSRGVFDKMDLEILKFVNYYLKLYNKVLGDLEEHNKLNK